MPTIIKMLDLSTAHLPRRVLDMDGEGITACHPKPYGLFLWVPSDDGAFDPDPDGDGDPDGDNDPAVLEVRAYARALGCDWILFDADADETTDLATYDGNTRIAPSPQPPPHPPAHKRRRRSRAAKVETCGRCGREFPAGGECSGPGYHP